MDAMPVRLGQVLGGWAAQIEAQIAGLRALQPRIQALAQGGTAVGTGINAHPDFAARFCVELSSLTGLEFTVAPDFFAAMGSQDAAVALSGALRGLAVSLLKIANDLRWMNSGPLAGLAEIELEALQPGSSIMPGKVNPVIPEAVAMAAAQVIGHDAAIAIAGQSGNFELNVMLPLVAHNLLDQLHLLAPHERAAGLARHRHLQGQRGLAAGGAGAQPDPGDGAEPGDRLQQGRRDRQARLQGRPRDPRRGRGGQRAGPQDAGGPAGSREADARRDLTPHAGRVPAGRFGKHRRPLAGRGAHWLTWMTSRTIG